ncbi:TetR/AcrR family transcriptional regulator [Salipiger bermudensis]|uniref:TetR/AcrR family transcriptional regulator n=1 Tax=Salipiger bermudensis TaxID=344736 RepID=UPI001C9942F0|nr:TetR/AcrR family transcriptional regulator [Salipiger bermudensis]MBY6006435.1 TetR/AcrR family transcriptional regulator [Salipiger bermudensis]
MPRTGLSPEDARRRAVEIALARIREHGFVKLRLAEVARDMGVSHAALYAHFRDKAALLDAVTESWLCEARARTASICAGSAPAAERIEQWFVARYRIKSARAQSDPEIFYGFNEATAGERPVIRDHMRHLREELTALVAEAGLGGRDEAEMLEEAMSAFLHPELIGPGPRPEREAALRRLVRVVLAGLAAEPGPRR